MGFGLALLRHLAVRLGALLGEGEGDRRVEERLVQRQPRQPGRGALRRRHRQNVGQATYTPARGEAQVEALLKLVGDA